MLLGDHNERFTWHYCTNHTMWLDEPMLRTHLSLCNVLCTHGVCLFVARATELPKAYFSPSSCASFMSNFALHCLSYLHLISRYALCWRWLLLLGTMLKLVLLLIVKEDPRSFFFLRNTRKKWFWSLKSPWWAYGTCVGSTWEMHSPLG